MIHRQESFLIHVRNVKNPSDVHSHNAAKELTVLTLELHNIQNINKTLKQSINSCLEIEAQVKVSPIGTTPSA